MKQTSSAKYGLYGLLAIVAVLSLVGAPTALAQLVAQPPDLPPGAVSYSGIIEGDLLKDANIIAALIGVGGLLVGSIITILASYLIRWMDVRRENRRETMMINRDKKEKEYQMKQELYRHFLNELAEIELFEQEKPSDVKRDWTRMEVKVDLVASETVREKKEKLQEELFKLAEKNLKNDTAKMSANYIAARDDLLSAIRKDIDILQKD